MQGFSRILVDNSLDGIFAFNTEMRFTVWNPIMQNLTGVPSEKAIGAKAQELFPHIVGTQTEDWYKRVLKGETIHIPEREFTHLRTHEKGFFEAKWLPQKDPSEIPIGGVCIVRDITSRKKAELSLIESSKMASLGQMAGNIAHELNTPLSVISAKADQINRLLKNETLQATRVFDDLQKIKSTVHRIAKIIHGLRIFFRTEENDPFSVVRIQQVIEDAVSLCSEKFRNLGIQIHLPPDSDYAVMGYAAQLVQVVLNLLNNASDAISNNADKWIKIEVLENSGTLEIHVTDSGTGIDSALQEKIMVPFFTTKPPGKGTGLGLSVSRDILGMHHGSLELDSTSQNTKFIIKLPRATYE